MSGAAAEEMAQATVLKNSKTTSTASGASAFPPVEDLPEKVLNLDTPTTLPLTSEQLRNQLIEQLSGKGLLSSREGREELSRSLLPLNPVDRGFVLTSAFFNKEIARDVIETSRSGGPANPEVLRNHDLKPIANLTDSTSRPSMPAQQQIDDFSTELMGMKREERVQALFSRLHGAKVAGEIYESAKLFGDLSDKSLNPYHVMLANYLAGSISAKFEQTRTLDGRSLLSAAAMLQEVTPAGHSDIAWNVEDALRIRKSHAESDAKVGQDVELHHKRVEDKKERYGAVAAYFGETAASYAKSYNARDSIPMQIFTLGFADSEKYLAGVVKKHPELEARTIRHAANCLDSGSIPLTAAERTEYAAQVTAGRKPKELVFGAILNPENFDMQFRLEAIQGRHAVLERVPIQPYDLRNQINYPSFATEDPVLPMGSPDNSVQIASKRPAAPGRIPPAAAPKEVPPPVIAEKTAPPVKPAEKITPQPIPPPAEVVAAEVPRPAIIPPEPVKSPSAQPPSKPQIQPAEQPKVEFVAQTPAPAAVPQPAAVPKPIHRSKGRLDEILFGTKK